MLAKKFQKYDFGAEENSLRYGTAEAPEYDLSRVQDVNLAMLCGTKDKLVSPGDYLWLRDQLGANVKFFKEYPLGHLGLQMPANKDHFADIAQVLADFC
jgi:hypothetical protein